MKLPVIRFEDPAPLTPGTAELREAFANALRQQPGRWALYGRRNSSGSARQFAYAIRQGLPHMPAGAFETEARTLFGEHRIYVRYVGDEPATAQAVAR